MVAPIFSDERVVAFARSRPGCSANTIAEYLGVSPARARRVCAEAGVELHEGPRIRIDAQMRERVLALYEAGDTQPAIAKALGIATGSVSSVVRAAGVSRARPPASHERIAELHARGMTTREIAEEVERSVCRVSVILRALGLVSHRPSRQQ